MTKDKPKSYRFSEETKQLLLKIAQHHMRNETNTLEFLVKQEADKLKIKLNK